MNNEWVRKCHKIIKYDCCFWQLANFLSSSLFLSLSGWHCVERNSLNHTHDTSTYSEGTKTNINSFRVKLSALSIFRIAILSAVCINSILASRFRPNAICCVCCSSKRQSVWCVNWLRLVCDFVLRKLLFTVYIQYSKYLIAFQSVKREITGKSLSYFIIDSVWLYKRVQSV